MSRRRSKWDVQASDITTESSNGSPKSATEAARERAAKLTAMLAAKGKLANSAGTPLPVMSQAVSQPPQKADKEQDLLYAEVEINDSPARAILCKGTTQDEINRYSGAAISTKGRYMDAEEKKNLNDGEKPLYLCIQATTQEKIERALKRIHEIKNGADIHGTPSQEQTSSHTRWSPYQSTTTTTVNNTNASIAVTITQQQNQTLPSGMHYIQDKVFVGLEHASPDFNVKDKLLGPGGSYFQHICTETGAKVFLRGKGSGFLEPTSGREAFEALHIYISHTKHDGLSAARKLVENLIQTVNNEFQTFEQRKRGPQPGYPPHPGYPQPGYMHPSYGYPPGMHQPPAGYPPPPVGPMVPPYGHIPPVPLQPPPPPHGQMMPPGYGAPPHQPAPHYPEPLMPGGTQNGGPIPYPANMPCPLRPDVPPGAYNGSQHQPPPPPADHPCPQPPKEEAPKDANKRNLERPPDITQPEPPKRRFKEVPCSESQQSSKPRASKKESSREASYLGTKKEKMSSQPSLPQQAPKKVDNHAMPPPPLPGVLVPPPKLQSKTSSDQKDFKKPLGLAKPFAPPPPPKVILGNQQKPSLSGTGSKKHGLPSSMENLEPKKAKREESENVSSYSAITSLVAYEGDSSEEEDEHLESAKSSTQNKNSSTSRTKQQQNLPFWAFQK